MISERLAKVLLRELQLDAYPLEDATTATQVPGWDSLKHVAILAAIEEEYHIRFRTLEVVRLKSVGELQELINKKIGS
ncbi:MAG: acyl carrier protein [Candidatus Tectimicrobiota bacterium]